MNTMPKAPRKTAKPRLANTCRLTLTIRSTVYNVRPTPCATGRAWQLRNLTAGCTYTVAETEHGPECDCGDATWRHGDGATFCKHVKAAAAVNLISLTAESDPATWPRWTSSASYAPSH